MSRNRLFLVAGSLAVAAAVSLISGITLLNRDVGSYIASHYRQESRDVNGTRYLCTGSPKQVATTLVKYQTRRRARRIPTPSTCVTATTS